MKSVIFEFPIKQKIFIIFKPVEKYICYSDVRIWEEDSLVSVLEEVVTPFFAVVLFVFFVNH